jgi:hypothetical protein
MPPKGKQWLITKSSPLKDGDASGNLGKPPDDVTKLASPSSRRESGAMTPKKTQHCRNDNDMSNIRQTLDVKPKSSNKKMTGLEEAQEEQSDADIYVSETSDAFWPSTSKYHSTSRSQKNPEVTIRTDHSDIDKLVMAIGSLTTTINESRESELKFCEDKCWHCESKCKYREDECRSIHAHKKHIQIADHSTLNNIPHMGGEFEGIKFEIWEPEMMMIWGSNWDDLRMKSEWFEGQIWVIWGWNLSDLRMKSEWFEDEIWVIWGWNLDDLRVKSGWFEDEIGVIWGWNRGDLRMKSG